MYIIIHRHRTVAMEEICSAVLEVSQTIMQQILHEFEESEPDRQHELLALGENVLHLLTLVEPYLPSNSPLPNDMITPVAETVEGMADTLEQYSRETRVRGRPSFQVPDSQFNFLLNHS